MGRIERLKDLIPKLKANKKIHPLKIESLEWELKYLESEKKQLSIYDVSISLRKDAIECLDALKYWNKQEFKNALHDGHTLDGMRPMILTKKLLKKLSNEC